MDLISRTRGTNGASLSYEKGHGEKADNRIRSTKNGLRPFRALGPFVVSLKIIETEELVDSARKRLLAPYGKLFLELPDDILLSNH